MPNSKSLPIFLHIDYRIGDDDVGKKRMSEPLKYGVLYDYYGIQRRVMFTTLPCEILTVVLRQKNFLSMLSCSR